MIYFLLNENCNLNCIHCIRGEKKYDNMSLEQYKKVVDKICSYYSKPFFLVTGGEPTLNKYLKEIIEYILTKNILRVMLISNGVSKKIIDISNDIKDERFAIQISIDGSKEYHDQIRGEGVFDKIINNIKTMSESGRKVYISSVVTKYNKNSMFILSEQLNKYNIGKWHINPVLPYGIADEKITLSINEWNEFVEGFRKSVSHNLSIHKMYDEKDFMKLSDEDIIRIANNSTNYRNCMTINEKIYIYPDGQVYGCTCLKDYPLGNILNEEVSSILESSNAKMLKNYKLNDDSPCQKCKYVKICNGGCIGMSLYKFKKIGVGDDRCPIFKRLSKQ